MMYRLSAGIAPAGISLGTLSAAALTQPPSDQLAISSSLYIQGSIFNALPVPVNAYTSLLPNVQAAVAAASQVCPRMPMAFSSRLEAEQLGVLMDAACSCSMAA